MSMKALQRIAIYSLVLSSFILNAQATYEIPRDPASEEESTSHNINIYSNLGLNITRISGVDDVGFGLTVGADTVWHFSQAVGLFAGLDYSQIKGEEGGQEVSVSYIDVPVGISFGVPSNRGYSHIINLGLYYGLPISDLKVGSTNFDAETITGLNFEGHSNYFITEGFSLGFHIQIKYGFKDIVNDNRNTFGTSSKPLTTSLGISAKFL